MDLDLLRKTALLRCQLRPDQPVLVGVSGGPDSLCLLASLAELGFAVTAAHFDHHLRPESAADAAVVEQVSARLGVPFLLGSGDVADFARSERISIETAARSLRYRFLFAQAGKIGAQAVAVGHTADDQVETVLMHILRGSGLNGLAGMAYRRVLPEWDARIPLVRPLLDFWREDTLACCRNLRLEPVMDATNDDTAFLRNRVRRELIPMLETYNPQARQAIWRLARAIAGDFQVIEAGVNAAWPVCVGEQGPGYVMLRLEALAPQPEGVQRGIIRRAVGRIMPLEDGLDFHAVERALRLAQDPATGVRVDLVDGLRAWVEGDQLVIARADADLPTGEWPQLPEDWVETSVPVPGDFHLAGGWRLSAQILDAAPPPDDPNQAWLDVDALAGPPVVRFARPGDRFQPLGMAGYSVKLSDFWTNAKLPRRARARWPLVISGGMVAWVAGMRLAHPYRVTDSTRQVLVLRLYRVAGK